ncbi:transmembrane protein 131-like protein [Anopheles sinensis]|uniref:Transmembrane protein 131-like protein n=1 Tax=Anopheles sinensis TaxID=74873 RepID=A0A084WAF8_ANOSI|nr:transmembrane protein 131-like protein [Anopheles sinensis]
MNRTNQRDGLRRQVLSESILFILEQGPGSRQPKRGICGFCGSLRPTAQSRGCGIPVTPEAYRGGRNKQDVRFVTARKLHQHRRGTSLGSIVFRALPELTKVFPKARMSDYFLYSNE